MSRRPPSRGSNGHAGRGPGRARSGGTTPAGVGGGGGSGRKGCPLLLLFLPLWPALVLWHHARALLHRPG